MQRIIVDWGTTNFRAYRFDYAGAVAETRHAPLGILAVDGGAFETALRSQIGDWLAPGVEVLLSGMITSRNGWVETPYAAPPATLADLAAATVNRPGLSGTSLRFLPGVATRDPTPDVMRGEEIQVFGSVGPNESATVILPGTHSKWVRVEEGRIVGFRTFFTGEMFSVLLKHSILGKLGNPDAPQNMEAFRSGVALASDPRSVSVLNDVFMQRAGALLGAWPADEIAERLSGCLIGHEMLAGQRLGWRHDHVILVGSPELCQRYAEACAICGIGSRMGPAMPTVEGFKRLIQETK